MSTATFCPDCGEVLVEDCECMLCDSDCIGVIGKGDAGREFSFFPKLDPDPNNVASCEDDGLLAIPTDYILAPPGCQAYHSANQPITDETIVVDLNSERYDSGGMHDNVTDNSQILITESGVHIVTFDAAFSAFATGDRTVYLRKNGLEYLGISAKSAVNSGSIQTGMSLTIVEEFEAGEYVEALARSDDTGGTLVNLLATRYSPVLTVQFRRTAT